MTLYMGDQYVKVGVSVCKTEAFSPSECDSLITHQAITAKHLLCVSYIAVGGPLQKE